MMSPCNFSARSRLKDWELGIQDRRKPECSGHDVQRVTTTKRWWLCKGCGYHFSTLGVRLPKTRCKR